MIAILFALSTAAAPVPGAINPNVNQGNLATTICVSGWTKTIRPPASYTNKLKRKQMAAMKLPGGPRLYEEDHLLPLEIGGHPTDPNNLWPEKWDGPRGAHKKDALENKLRRLVCAGTITLEQAQHEISTDWVASFRKRIGKLP